MPVANPPCPPGHMDWEVPAQELRGWVLIRAETNPGVISARSGWRSPGSTALFEGV